MTGASHLVEDQSEAIAFLTDPRTHGGAAVERIDTHGAVVVLAGERAYKLKRAVRFPYMDFSTLERRRGACAAELAINRRTAPTLYLGVEPIMRTASGGLALGGDGAAVDWLVVMRRFDQDALFDRMAARGALDKRLIAELADAILNFHRAAERRFDHGGASGLGRVIAGNDRDLRAAGAERFDQARVARLRAQSGSLLGRLAALLDGRREAGLVRHCHGDLHLRNICLFDGRPTLFDAIEFNESIACIDLLYDLAFLLMDLDDRGLGGFGNLLFNRYYAEASRAGVAGPPASGPDDLGDLRGLAALPLFLSCRAAVRAHVGAAVAAAQTDPRLARTHGADAQAYLERALGYLSPPPPRLVAIGGLSGTGKSTLAQALAPRLGPVPGALMLRSDIIRKHLLGRDALDRLGPEGYTAELTARVYQRIREGARTALAAGHAVIADAVHGRPDERAAIEAVARELRVGFEGLWLEAPADALAARIAERTADASDATVEVLRQQLAWKPGPIAWRRFDAAGAPETTLDGARRALGLSVGGTG